MNRNVINAFIFLCALAACDAANAPSHSAQVEWTPLPEEQVRALCKHDDYPGGCVKKYQGVCRIITLQPPLREFTGYNHDMHSRVWPTMGHELLHCFGYEHQAGD